MSIWNQLLFQERNSPVIQMLRMFHDYSLAVIIIILVLVGGISLFTVFNRFVRRLPITVSIEVIWTVLPVLVLVLLAIPSLKILYYIEEIDPFLNLKVIGHQWFWSYELMNVVEFDSYIVPAASYRLLDVDHRVVLPIRKRVRALITRRDVLHRWAVPRLALKADAVPGRLNMLNFTILRSSISFGQCSEICGANHRFMPICVEAISLPNFFNWFNSFLPSSLKKALDF